MLAQIRRNSLKELSLRVLSIPGSFLGGGGPFEGPASSGEIMKHLVTTKKMGERKYRFRRLS